jgi:hypothetical protein
MPLKPAAATVVTSIRMRLSIDVLLEVILLPCCREAVILCHFVARTGGQSGSRRHRRMALDPGGISG